MSKKSNFSWLTLTERLTEPAKNQPIQVDFRVFFRCPKAAVSKLCGRNLLPKPLYFGNSRAGFVDRRYLQTGKRDLSFVSFIAFTANGR
jgi:hypothetical protein